MTLPIPAPFLFLLFLLPMLSADSSADREALLSFKGAISDDPLGALDSWNESTPLCQWHGVTCGGGTAEQVTQLALNGTRLTGHISPIPSALSNCSELLRMDLRNNNLRGKIPPELGSFPKLQFLSLSSNNLTGPIPSSLANISTLGILDLSNNSLRGSIPPELGDLSNLTMLYLFTNDFTGAIPPRLGNLSTLTHLYLYENLLEGEIPAELGGMKNLKVLDVYVNRLSGRIPSSVWNLSSLIVLHVGYNQLSGLLPWDLGQTLPNLGLYLFGNQFEGVLSPFLSNATGLELLEAAQNRLEGVIPSDLGKLQSLRILDLSDNSFQARAEEDWSFISSLTNCSNLTKLEIKNNSLGGVLPPPSPTSRESWRFCASKRIKLAGGFPRELGESLHGRNPRLHGELGNLKELSLEENMLSGGSHLLWVVSLTCQTLSLGGNLLEGRIPTDFGGLRNLQALNLSDNRLHGEIPREILSLTSLSLHLDLSGNYLIGSLLPEIGKLKNLNTLNLSRNRLSGEIPSSIGDCQVLEFLLLESNLFQGVIPWELSKLKGIQELDLSRNRLSGEVPEFLEGLSLRREVPRGGIFENGSATSLVGNEGLCGGNPGMLLRPCRQRRRSVVIKVVVPIGVVLFVVLMTASLFAYCWKKKRSSGQKPLPSHLGEISYGELHRSTDGFSPDNIIGRGAHGCVYRGKLGKRRVPVAVKVLDLGSVDAARSFMAECEALWQVRHRNLVKTMGSFSGADFQGNEFKALVYELVPNGCLDQSLDLLQRLSIAIDVASAIEYLHQCIDIPIIHRDLKPRNVLLDDGMTARVSDFGLARFLSSGSSHCTTRSIGLKGTIGYVAPELTTLGRVSTGTDVYSFGILLLEMFTGKRPTDSIFAEGLTLHSFVREGLPHRVMAIADPQLLCGDGKEDGGGADVGPLRNPMIDCLISVFKLGLLCAEESQRNRPKLGTSLKR
ncbi:unnamed protein product [Spirodela intermedia]|uniref:non-specific serine/threonine protein kinase n=1 Tax=Spirodela intermedia TaxID=51605 RepID=A0A7I8IS98_SPIIN|nr:unnamed protein product [Spirodela intermedia]CAA6660886.1 unnamed protein product [Spirodela intermedia]